MHMEPLDVCLSMLILQCRMTNRSLGDSADMVKTAVWPAMMSIPCWHLPYHPSDDLSYMCTCIPTESLACRAESIRTGFMLAQGGEFAFVLLSLAKELKVLPDELNRLLIIVVVLSMALTPLLAEVGETMASRAIMSDEGLSFELSGNPCIAFSVILRLTLNVCHR